MGQYLMAADMDTMESHTGVKKASLEDSDSRIASVESKVENESSHQQNVVGKSSRKSSLVKYLSRKLSLNLKNSKELNSSLCEYIMSHTGHSRAEVESFYNKFLKFHPSGSINYVSFQKILRESVPGCDSSDLAQHVWRLYDTNLDGEIDFGEFMLALQVMRNGSPEQNLRQIFRIFDVNSDGRVEIQEMDKVVEQLRKVGEVGEDTVEKAFMEMDSDRDGSVTQDEFVQACLHQRKASTEITLKVIDIFVRGEEKFPS